MDVGGPWISTKNMVLLILFSVGARAPQAFGQKEPVGTYQSLAEAPQHADIATTLILNKNRTGITA